jgi:phage shock protein PspC (stress-responsive transcriptional regulator)
MQLFSAPAVCLNSPFDGTDEAKNELFLGDEKMSADYKRLYRSRTDRMFSGLCAGIGQYVGIDPTVVRVLFALATLVAFPMPLLVYFAMMILVPEEPLAAESPATIGSTSSGEIL